MEYTDQMNRSVQLEKTPQRIISLVPSQTQLLHALGLESEVVGITKFCIYPDHWFRGKHRVGGTKAVSFDKIEALNPDLIIGNKEENERSDIEMLEREFPVWMSDIFNLEDALQMIEKIGQLVGKESAALELIQTIKNEFSDLKDWIQTSGLENKTVAYVIWNDPMYCAGRNTFIDTMLSYCGLTNFIGQERYPEINEAASAAPDYIFLSSEPFPFKTRHIAQYEEKFPNSKVKIVDGEMFSWYGSKLTEAPKYFRTLLENLASE